MDEQTSVVPNPSAAQLAMATVIESLIKGLKVPFTRQLFLELIQIVEENPFMFFDSVTVKTMVNEKKALCVLFIPRSDFSAFFAAYKSGEFQKSKVA